MASPAMPHDHCGSPICNTDPREEVDKYSSSLDKMQSPTILVLLIMTTVLSHQPAPPPVKSRHFPWNYTWIVLSERGDIVWSRSQTSPDVWWPNVLQPDLCVSGYAPWRSIHLITKKGKTFGGKQTEKSSRLDPRPAEDSPTDGLKADDKRPGYEN
ncbi:Kinase D-interacting substrate of 220 kDa [Manis javanica]|nr:Kinase D-interacting substrate of 220 kDa [Manis javanica]